ncbi:hypothetical protein NOC27_188 [Nitrosococcus oceani AFC27]|nr:hypothetical protein NOC27_188 [Nitrosococcus oceani AFC27]
MLGIAVHMGILINQSYVDLRPESYKVVKQVKTTSYVNFAPG